MMIFIEVRIGKKCNFNQNMSIFFGKSSFLAMTLGGIFGRPTKDHFNLVNLMYLLDDSQVSCCCCRCCRSCFFFIFYLGINFLIIISSQFFHFTK